MSQVIHRADTRGFADHGWLKTSHTFSFASYYDPERMGFGLLRVLNDDIVEPSQGFGTHPHDNMEIVSIPLSGSLRHQDSEGNRHIMSAGDVQIMSAGTGIRHSEYNNSESEDVNFLQIWVMPRKKDIAPRYGQKSFDPSPRRNRFQALVVPDDASGDVLRINQDAWFSLADLEAGAKVGYEVKKTGSGVYLFVIEGQVEAAGESLGRRDGMGLSGEPLVEIEASGESTVLAIDVPLK